jgi:hypothetical protein
MEKKKVNAIQTLPEGYESDEIIDIAKQVGLSIVMNVVGLLLFFIAYTVLFRLVRNIRSVASMQFFKFQGLGDTFLIILAAILFMAALIILHEAAHGLFFWRYTGTMPKFAFKISYAYAAAPDWYIPRNAYLVIGAAPVVFITVIGFLCCLFIPASMLVPLVLFISLNFASSVGDFYVLLRLMTKPSNTYVKDEGDKMTFYRLADEDSTL